MWKTRFILFVVSFVIGLSSNSSKAQSYDIPRFNSLEMMRLKMESMSRQNDREAKEAEQFRIKADFEADQKDFTYTREMAALYLELMQSQEVYYATKWPPNNAPSGIDVGKQLQIRLIKDELLKREKQTKKHLERK